jgi:hypothetical protein
VLLHCAEANKTPLHGACADLLVHLVSDALTETAYLASVCELGSSLAADDGGFAIRVHGFDDKLLDLFSVMFEVLMEFRGREDGSLPKAIKDGRFDLCLETYRRQCINVGMKSSKLATGVRIRCLRPNSWSSHQQVRPILSALCSILVSSSQFSTSVSIRNSSRRSRSLIYRPLQRQYQAFLTKLG